ncbi:MAG TPA: hypothetical protein VG326_01450 [Tepidisphaeraceae bacterium]|jgi:hypothetical protein|nr:hypothetical protein [Tepidisphaeraceae bacterium]
MNPDDLTLPPAIPAGLPPLALPYSNLKSARPVLISTVSIIGIVIASLGIIASAYGALAAVFMGMMRAMRWQTSGAMNVGICEAIVGAGLAGALMTGSIGLLRLRPWSRRVLLYWAWAYLLNAVCFLVLQIMIVVPSQVGMFSKIMASMPVPAPTTAPATAPSGAVPVVGTTTFYYATSTGGASAVAAPRPMAPIMTAPMMAVMRTTYTTMAVGKTLVCIIFPIAILIVMRLKSIRSALALQPHAEGQAF